MRYYPLDMDSEAKVSGLAKKKEKISWVLPAFGIDDAAHKSTGTAGWVAMKECESLPSAPHHAQLMPAPSPPGACEGLPTRAPHT